MKNGNKRKIPVILTPEEVNNLIKQPNKNVPTGLRNKAILSLLWDSGARVGDILNLKPGNISITKREAFFENGKYGVDRWVGFSEYTADLLDRYKKARPKGEYLFCTLSNELKDKDTKKRDTRPGNKLDRVYLYNMIRRYAKRAGINKRVGLHTIRHSFATDYLKRTKNLATLQKILGHKSIKTTSVYLHYDKTDVIEGLNQYWGKRDKTKEEKTLDKIAVLEDQLRAIKEQMTLSGKL